MTGINPVDRSELGTKRHILTDKKGISMSAVITSASTYDVKAVTDVIDSAVIKQQQPTPSNLSTKTKTMKQHLCLDRAYNSKAVEQEIIKRGYVPHMPPREGEEGRGERIKIRQSEKDIIQEGGGLWRERIHGIQVQKTVYTV